MSAWASFVQTCKRDAYLASIQDVILRERSDLFFMIFGKLSQTVLPNGNSLIYLERFIMELEVYTA